MTNPNPCAAHDYANGQCVYCGAIKPALSPGVWKRLAEAKARGDHELPQRMLRDLLLHGKMPEDE